VLRRPIVPWVHVEGYPDQTGQRFLRTLNIETGKVFWEVEAAKAKTWAGVLATVGGVVF
jgi:hypothetical protein